MKFIGHPGVIFGHPSTPTTTFFLPFFGGPNHDFYLEVSTFLYNLFKLLELVHVVRNDGEFGGFFFFFEFIERKRVQIMWGTRNQTYIEKKNKQSQTKYKKTKSNQGVETHKNSFGIAIFS